MALELVTKVSKYVDEVFTSESKRTLITNQNYDWEGAHTVKIYMLDTVGMTDYQKEPENGYFATSAYGPITHATGGIEEFYLRRDRSFTFVIGKLEEDETDGIVQAGTALARQEREVIIPEIDAYTYGQMAENAGHKPEAVELTPENIYDEIIKANKALDNSEVPETQRYLLVTPDIYYIMKKSSDIVMNTEIGQDMRLLGVVSNLDGCTVIKVASNRVPKDFGFMIAHPCATVAPVKIQEYKVHRDPPGFSGSLVEGRVVYDAFVLKNKANAIYYQKNKTAESTE